MGWCSRSPSRIRGGRNSRAETFTSVPRSVPRSVPLSSVPRAPAPAAIDGQRTRPQCPMGAMPALCLPPLLDRAMQSCTTTTREKGQESQLRHKPKTWHQETDVSGVLGGVRPDSDRQAGQLQGPRDAVILDLPSRIAAERDTRVKRP